jgi:D-glycero-D-manno-heptose 1,7-bisphosphate phosphatase
MRRAIFLDRDGVVNKYEDHLYKPEDFELLSGSPEAIGLINNSDFLSIIVTNQAGIARGIYSEEQMYALNKHMTRLLHEKGVHVDALYFCPHHPKIGNNPYYTKECDCRKPKPGMLLQAKKDLEIDLKNSWMIGDSYSDVHAGISAGCKTILLGERINDERTKYDPDFRCTDLYHAICEVILK